QPHLAGDALTDDARVTIDEDAHGWTAVKGVEESKRSNNAGPAPRTVLGANRSHYLFGGIGEAVGRDDLAAAGRQHVAGLFYSGSFQPHDQGNVETDFFVRGQKRLDDRVALHDAAEDVDQHALDVLVGQQNAERLGHLIGIGTASHVQKIGRFAAVQLDQVH